ncbi:MAG TPA: PPE domain-containing protein [Pseudonocardiaceae bacterium]|nr:PPE domain-containing protein [Pseudonocardiaceae bacterium]
MRTDIDYSTVSHETIYQNITSGAGSTDLITAGQAWESIAARLQQLIADVERAIQGIGAAQRGAAADTATHATLALVPWLEHNAATANDIARLISQQADSFGHTRNNMPKPVTVPEVSFLQNPFTWIGDQAVEWLPGIQTDHERAHVQAQESERRAQDLMNSYQDSANDTLAPPRRFEPAPPVVSDRHPAGPGSGHSPGGGGGFRDEHRDEHREEHREEAHPEMTHPDVIQPTTPGPPPAEAPPHADAVVPPGPSPRLAPGAQQPPPAEPPAAEPPPASMPQLAEGYHPGAEGQLGESGQFRPPATAPIGPSPLLVAPALNGPMSQGSGFGPRPTPASGEGHSQAGNAWQASAGHASPTRSVTGFTSTPLGATGNSADGEDSEHRRPSYLLEQDTNGIVGELPRVAPPVIGEV